MKLYKLLVKPLLDRLLAFFALLVFSPVLLLTTILVLIKLGRPIFFLQKRPGLNGEVFTLIKYRTMSNDKGKDGSYLNDSVRLTNFGKKLRASSLDELPSLVSVLKGDMSLVGPRPLLVEYLSLYSEEQSRRHNVKPGITGWAQVNGRNAISWEEKFKLDVWYVENQSFLLDLKILFLTIQKVWKKEGVNSENHVTAEPFLGNKND